MPVGGLVGWCGTINMSFNVKEYLCTQESGTEIWSIYMYKMYTVLYDATLELCCCLWSKEWFRGTDFVLPANEWYHYCILPVVIYDLALINARA